METAWQHGLHYLTDSGVNLTWRHRRGLVGGVAGGFVKGDVDVDIRCGVVVVRRQDTN
jgi:hypothetical protein